MTHNFSVRWRLLLFLFFLRKITLENLIVMLTLVSRFSPMFLFFVVPFMTFFSVQRSFLYFLWPLFLGRAYILFRRVRIYFCMLFEVFHWSWINLTGLILRDNYNRLRYHFLLLFFSDCLSFLWLSSDLLTFLSASFLLSSQPLLKLLNHSRTRFQIINRLPSMILYPRVSFPPDKVHNFIYSMSNYGPLNKI